MSGFALVVFTMPQGWGSDWHANPLLVHSPNREHYATCPHLYVLLDRTIHLAFFYLSVACFTLNLCSHLLMCNADSTHIIPSVCLFKSL